MQSAVPKTLATNAFAPPADACTSYTAFYSRLQELEGDLHRHIHLENNILFPRAIQVEEETRTTPVGAALKDSCCPK